MVDAKQAAYLFGPSRVIALVGGKGDGGIVERPDELPESTSGPILFHGWQIEVLDKRQRDLWRQKVASKLRQEFRAQTLEMSDVDLLQKVRKYQAESIRRGMGTQDAIYNWARLELATNGQAGKNKILEQKIAQIPSDIRSEVFVLAAPGFANSINGESFSFDDSPRR